jgi:putative membrane protein insertion efficiency factor
MNPIIAWAAVSAIKTYRLAISPWFGTACRFTPGCSTYTQEAIVRHGAVRGIGLGLRRLSRCHPWGGNGYDPVPAHRHDTVSARPATAR